MKKISLIITTIFIVCFLSGCSKEKTELEIFLDNINGSVDSLNYCVSYNNQSTNYFNVQGNNVHFFKEELNTVDITNLRDEYYSFTRDSDGFYNGGTKYVYNNTIDNIKMYDKFTINNQNMMNDIEEATTNPLKQVSDWANEKDMDFDDFEFDSTTNKYYYVNESYSKKEKAKIDVTSSLLTISFLYENDELISVTVNAQTFGVWTFSDFGDIDIIIPTDSQIRT